MKAVEINADEGTEALGVEITNGTVLLVARTGDTVNLGLVRQNGGNVVPLASVVVR